MVTLLVYFGIMALCLVALVICAIVLICGLCKSNDPIPLDDPQLTAAVGRILDSLAKANKE
jgi:hypothetical protein